jgi:hypothetical protein
MSPTGRTTDAVARATDDMHALQTSLLAAAAVIAFTPFGWACKSNQPSSQPKPSTEEVAVEKRIDVPKEFEAELRKRGVQFKRAADGRYEITRADDFSLFVSLDNLELNVLRDRDSDAIRVFVDRVLERNNVEPEESRTWAEARPFVYFSAEPNDYEFHDTIRSSVSRQVELILTVTSEKEGTVAWVNPAMLKAWNVSREVAEKAAGENLDRLLHGKKLEVERVGAMRLGMVPIDSPYKASVIFAPHFREFVEPQLGWPVLAVTPCRDFIYVFPNTDFDLVGRSGRVVLREYSTSGYPITTEVWRISDAGVEAIGTLGDKPDKKRE